MGAILAALRGAGLLPADQVQALARAYALHQALQAVLRLSLSDRFDPATAPARLLEALVRAAALALEGEAPPADFAMLQRVLIESQAAVRQIFDELCPPAAGAA
ncbi:MAG TPA: hypothetical protein VFY87_06675 [Geminicoccaceae bacterium]|nr:hypothetical protein [Geminicoccaceae bacterium]